MTCKYFFTVKFRERYRSRPHLASAGPGLCPFIPNHCSELCDVPWTDAGGAQKFLNPPALMRNTFHLNPCAVHRSPLHEIPVFRRIGTSGQFNPCYNIREPAERPELQPA